MVCLEIAKSYILLVIGPILVCPLVYILRIKACALLALPPLYICAQALLIAFISQRIRAPAEIGLTQPCTVSVRFAEIYTTEVRVAEVHPAEICPGYLRAGEDSASEICIAQDRIAQNRIAQVGV